MAENFLKSILVGFAEAMLPLREALSSTEKFTLFLKQFGWTLDSSDLTRVGNSLGSLQSVAENPTSKNLQDLADNIISACNIIRNIGSSGAPEAFVSTFPRELLDYLVYMALAVQSPQLFALLHLIGIFSERRLPENSEIGRGEYIKRSVHWERFSSFIDDPLESIKQSYGWGTDFDADAFLRSLGILIAGFGGRAGMYPANRNLVNEYYAHGSKFAAGMQNLMLSPRLLEESVSSGTASANFKLAFLGLPIPPESDSAAPPDGIAFMPVITGQASESISLSENVTLNLSGDFLGRPIRAEIHPGSAVVRSSVKDTQIGGSVQLQADAPADKPWLPVGDADSSRLEISSVHASLEMTGQLDGDLDLSIEIGIDEAALIIDFSKGDGFLQDILGSQPSESPISFTIKWSNKEGLSFQGQPRLEMSFPTHQSLAKFAYIDKIDIALGAEENKTVALDLTLSGNASLGPVMAVFENLGMRLSLAYLDESDPPGNLGTADLQFGFKHPNNIGINVDAKAVTGGGFLEFDPENHRYAGVLSLNLKSLDMELAAIGLITTRLPNNQKGYSMLISMSVLFKPAIQLAFGFTLEGIGGLVGIHRTMKVDVLRQRIKTGALDSIMFPKDVIKNAPKIISDLRAVFPPQKKHYVFAPLLKLGWGTPSVIEIDLGVLVELPFKDRLILIGNLDIYLPNKETETEKEKKKGKKKRLGEIHVDVFGDLNFAESYMLIEGRLRDSRIANIDLSGCFAFVLDWGRAPQFLLSVGGYHPRYNKPERFPDISRLTALIRKGNSFSLVCKYYQAITSNSYQIGLLADLLVKYGAVTVSGHLNFDALLQFDPFMFEVDILLSVSVRYKGRNLAGVELSFLLSGPEPWNAKGYAKIDILFISLKVKFSHTWGGQQEVSPSIIQAKQLLDKLHDQLQEDRNWAGKLPAGYSAVESLRSLEATGVDGAIPVHPTGYLELRQTVVPLNQTIEKSGSSHLDARTAYRIVSYELGKGDKAIMINANEQKPVLEYFSRGQYRNLSDAEKISTPDFELMPAGVNLGSDLAHDFSDEWHSTESDYEDIILPRRDESVSGNEKINWQAEGFFSRAAIKRSVKDEHLARKFGMIDALPDFDERRYRVVSKEDLEAPEPWKDKHFTTFSAAEDFLQTELKNETKKWQILEV